MAIVGQPLVQPEVGWRRYDNTDSLIEYRGNFTHETVTGAYRNTTSFNPKMSTEGEIHFYFEGESIRILSPNHPTIRTPKASIFIDGTEYEIKCNYVNDYSVLSFEKIGLLNGLHKVVIKNFTLNTGTTSMYAPFGLDAIDINIEGKLRLPYNNMIIKNQSTNKHYSLADKTLIHLPNDTDKNMILFGMKQGEEITLNVPFTKQNYVNDTPVGKVFTQSIESGHTLNIKEIEKDYVPIVQWHETNMTSNNTPPPLVASASTEYNTSMQAWKAFNGTLSDSSDRWRSSDSTANQWLKVDFGEQITAEFMMFTAVFDSSTIAGSPIEFTLEGSNDDSTWQKISDVVTTNFVVKEVRTFFFNKVNYRYFKITPIKNQGNVAYFNIGDIKFGYKREVN